MEKFPLLDLVIGLSLIYTFLSLLASELAEFAIAILQWRTKRLTRCIITLLGESSLQNNLDQFKDTVAGKLLNSLDISAVVQSTQRRSQSMILAEIIPHLFAEKLLEILQSLSLPNSPNVDSEYTPSKLDQLMVVVKSSSDLSPQLRTNLIRLIHRIQIIETDPEQQMIRLKREIALWFSHAMAGVLSTNKYSFKIVSLLVSLVLTVAVNVDSLYIIRRISENTATRAVIMQNATLIQGCQNRLSSSRCTERTSFLMESTTIPVGWQPSNRVRQFPKLSHIIILRTIGGWFLTIIAVAMGSRFWLQLLGHLSTVLYWTK